MDWAEVKDLTGWLCKYEDRYTVITKRGAGLDVWLGYPPVNTIAEAIEFVKVSKENDFLLYVYDKDELIPIQYIYVGFNSKLSWKMQVLEKSAAPESYTSGSDVDQPEFKNLNQWHTEDKNLPFLKDEFIGEDEAPLKFVLDPNSNGYQKFDNFPDQAYDGVKASLKLSFELPKAEEVNQYDINPLTEMNLYPSKRKDNCDYKKRNTKGDEEMLFEKGLHQSMDRPETSRDIIPFGSKLSWNT